MPQNGIPCLSFSINDLQIENVYNFNFLGLTKNCYLDWKPHLNSIGIKIARVIGLFRKLKYTLPTRVLRSIYNSLILPHMHICTHLPLTICILRIVIFIIITLDIKIIFMSLWHIVTCMQKVFIVQVF